MFPVELSLVFSRSKSSWLRPILSDAACLHFTVFVTKTYLDFVHKQNEQNNKTAQAHFVKALSILQQRLANSDNEISTSDSTILIVVGLTMVATFRGDYKTALKHLRGLQNMVMLRGGFAALEENKQLQTKIFRQVEPIL